MCPPENAAQKCFARTEIGPRRHAEAERRSTWLGVEPERRWPPGPARNASCSLLLNAGSFPADVESESIVSSISRRGMVQFGGNTYRIIKRDAVHEIVRVLDDRSVGSFRRLPSFEIIECRIERDVVLAIAQLALHTGRLSYQPKREPTRSVVDDWLESFHWNDLPSAALLLGAAHQLLLG